MKITVYTIGYRGRTHEQVAAIIKAAGLKCPVIVDVRRWATGARIAKGWDLKSVWHKFMRLVGWQDDYHFFQQLGNYGKEPHWTRHQDAGEALLQVAYENVLQPNRTRRSPVILLCAERKAAECHRSEVAEALCRILDAVGIGCEVVHL